MVHVVGGVIIVEGRILLTQRRKDQDFPFMWECPGGRVENGESFATALTRELHEELGGIESFHIGVTFFTRNFNNPVARADRTDVTYHLINVEYFKGTPRPMEGQGLGWFSLSELAVHKALMSLAPGLTAAFEQIVEYMEVRP